MGPSTFLELAFKIWCSESLDLGVPPKTAVCTESIRRKGFVELCGIEVQAKYYLAQKTIGRAHRILICVDPIENPKSRLEKKKSSPYSFRPTWIR